MAAFLGLLVAVFYGSGDVFGGIATKRSPVSAVVISAGLIAIGALIVTTAIWALFGTLPHPTSTDLWLGAGAGMVGPLAIGMLYQGLASGRMSVVAPITAVVAATVPFAWGLVHGERPSTLGLFGVALALPAVALISGAPAHPEQEPPIVADPGGTGDVRRIPVIPLAIGSGIGFGMIFVLLGSTSDTAGLWPLCVARPVGMSLATVTMVVLSRRAGTPLRHAVIAPRDAWLPVAGSGLLDMLANGIYLAATRLGLLSIVAVLSSLYPASTVLLARVVLNERLHRRQLLGLAVGIIGVAAMAAA